MIEAKLTREWFRRENACYDDAKIAALIPADGMTLFEVLDLDIPAEDRIWGALTGDAMARSLKALLATRSLWRLERSIADAGWTVAPLRRDHQLVDYLRVATADVAELEELAMGRATRENRTLSGYTAESALVQARFGHRRLAWLVSRYGGNQSWKQLIAEPHRKAALQEVAADAVGSHARDAEVAQQLEDLREIYGSHLGRWTR